MLYYAQKKQMSTLFYSVLSDIIHKILKQILSIFILERGADRTIGNGVDEKSIDKKQGKF